MASLTSENQEEFDFHVRKLERDRIDFQSLLVRVNDGCKKIHAGEKFAEATAAFAFLREYVVVRDIAAVAQYKEQLSKYGITAEHLRDCQQIVSDLESTLLASHLKSTLFHEMKQSPFGQKEFEKLFHCFAVVAGLVDKPR